MKSSRIHTSWFKNYTNPHKLRPHIKLATEIQTVTLTLTNKPFFLQTCLFGISDAFSKRGIHSMLLKLNIKKITRWKRWKKSELQNDRNFYSREKREKSFWADIIKLFISEWCFYRDNEYWQLLNSLLFPIICVCMFLFFRNFLFYFRFWHNCIEKFLHLHLFWQHKILKFFSQFTSTLIQLFCNQFFFLTFSMM